MNPLRLLAVLAIASFTGCSPVSNAWVAGWTANEANDRIMLVRAEPPSFGMERLMGHARLFPDVALFVSKKGLPDFIAEMSNKDRHYLILYYLESKQAFACRTNIENRHEVEFAGPYPITPKEYRTLAGFRRKSQLVNATRVTDPRL
ncbi:hypothetical protein [Luteolibacter sp. LG18]|uniref:hypothetical protein n=1 Tax=Luteolibacter sp. LG18 TaxID=2819286 RepID=UPI002B27F9DC|nr:hypothetical protein llg_08650 [Luteolibacter sp. LG18]